MTSLVFPDVNVWLALATSIHSHHERARRWYGALQDQEIVFCRFTQLGLLRLLTTSAVMGSEVLSQKQAWKVYDAFVENGGAALLVEPRSLEESFRKMSRSSSASPKEWADSYLAAFALEVGATLITFDKALASRSRESTLL